MNLRFLASTLAVIAFAMLVGPAGSAGSAKAPTLRLVSTKVTVTKPRDGYGGRAAVRVDFCAAIGPSAALVIRERRVVSRLTKAASRSTEPLGVDLQRVLPYACTRNFSVGWLVRTRFLGAGGIYSVTVRLRDARGRLTRPVGFSLRPG